MDREIARLKGKKALQSWYVQKRWPLPLPFMQNFLNHEKADIIIAYDELSNYYACQSSLNCPVIRMIHDSPEHLLAEIPNCILNVIQQSTAIQVLLPGYQNYLRQKYPSLPVYVIPNVVPQVAQSVNLLLPKRRYSIITVGRIEKDKGQEILIRAFALLAKRFPEWDVHLWGSDETQGGIAKLIRKLNLEGRVFLKGVSNQIMQEYSRADIFAFPSLHEGFPLALTEAMSSGLPAVGFQSSSGVNEIIKDGISGFLVADGSNSFANGLGQLMEKQELRSKLGRNAHEEMKQYAPNIVWDTWEDLILRTIAKR